MTDSLFPDLARYDAFLSLLKMRIRTAQVRATLAVNLRYVKVRTLLPAEEINRLKQRLKELENDQNP